MHEPKSLGMKRLTRTQFETIPDELLVLRIDGPFANFRPALSLIIEKRMAYPVEMHADLMGASGLQTTFHNGHISEPLQNPIMGNSMLPMVSVRENLEAHPVIWVTADITDYRPLVIFQITPHNRDVTALYRVDEKLFCKVELGFIVLRHDQKA